MTPSQKEQNPVKRESINEITNGIKTRIKICFENFIDTCFCLSDFLKYTNRSNPENKHNSNALTSENSNPKTFTSGRNKKKIFAIIRIRRATRRLLFFNTFANILELIFLSGNSLNISTQGR